VNEHTRLALRVWAAERRDDPGTPPELVSSAVTICHLLDYMGQVAADNVRSAMAEMVLCHVVPFLTGNQNQSL